MTIAPSGSALLSAPSRYAGPSTDAVITVLPRTPVLHTTEHQAEDPGVPTRVIDDRLCTNRTGIATLAGWTPGHSVNVRARKDPDFPRGVKLGREYWYPFEGTHGVDAYLVVLADRARAKKPPAVKPGNPDDLLSGPDAADALHIEYSTFRSYVRSSVPIWTGRRRGHPILPRPNVEYERDSPFGPYTYRAWYRANLAAHQEQRPGRGLITERTPRRTP